MLTEKLLETNPWKSMFGATEQFSSDFMSTRTPGIESTREAYLNLNYARTENEVHVNHKT